MIYRYVAVDLDDSRLAMSATGVPCGLDEGDIMADEQALRALNIEIGVRESSGDVAFFGTRLAGAFAMRRANGDLDDRDKFLAKVVKSDQRDTTVDAVTYFGDRRALVECTVVVGANRFHNLRLFIRDGDSEAPWLLLGWANELVSEGSSS